MSKRELAIPPSEKTESHPQPSQKEAWLSSADFFDAYPQIRQDLTGIGQEIRSDKQRLLTPDISTKISALIEQVLEKEPDQGKRRIILREASKSINLALGYDEDLATSIAQKYLLTNRIGSGGAAEVYAAKAVIDPQGMEDVVKVVAGRMAEDEMGERKNEIPIMFAEMLKGEMKHMANIRHRNIVPIYAGDIIEKSGGLGLTQIEGWYAMPKIEGGDLVDFLKKNWSDGKELPLDEGLDIAVQLADGVEAVHKAGVVHNDLKPANVFIEKEKSGDHLARLGDFGLSKFILEQTHTVAAGLNEADQFSGTPGYVAPEEIKNEYPSDPHSLEKYIPKRDIFSLGVIYYQLFSGTSPFVQPGDTPIVAYQKVLQGDRKGLASLRPGLPRELHRLIDDMLDLDPSNRPDAQEVGFVLKHLRLQVKSDKARQDLLTQWPDDQPASESAKQAGPQSLGEETSSGVMSWGRRLIRRFWGAKQTTPQAEMAVSSDTPVSPEKGSAPKADIPKAEKDSDKVEVWPKNHHEQRVLIRGAITYANEISLEDLEKSLGVSRGKLGPRLAEMIREGEIERDVDAGVYKRRNLQSEVKDLLYAKATEALEANKKNELLRLSAKDLAQELEISEKRAIDILEKMHEQDLGTFTTTDKKWLTLSETFRADTGNSIESFYYYA